MRSFAVSIWMVLLFSWSATPAVATEVSELLLEPGNWSGQVIEVSGEIVGDYGHHSGAYWLQLNDDTYAVEPLLETGKLTGSNVGITIRVPPSLFDEIASTEQPGGYRWRGPIVRVKGEFRYHDPGRSGETYIAVTNLELVEPGHHLPSEATGPWGMIGVVLAAGAGIVLMRHARQRRREWRLEE
ncbi:MAG: hypothetical protein OEX97_03155 [Acidimicrobiia bacterium]|nr:hypothetical protein [Acidimicrobiia bacterium]